MSPALALHHVISRPLRRVCIRLTISTCWIWVVRMRCPAFVTETPHLLLPVKALVVVRQEDLALSLPHVHHRCLAFIQALRVTMARRNFVMALLKAPLGLRDTSSTHKWGVHYLKIVHPPVVTPRRPPLKPHGRHLG